MRSQSAPAVVCVCVGVCVRVWGCVSSQHPPWCVCCVLRVAAFLGAHFCSLSSIDMNGGAALCVAFAYNENFQWTLLPGRLRWRTRLTTAKPFHFIFTFRVRSKSYEGTRSGCPLLGYIMSDLFFILLFTSIITITLCTRSHATLRISHSEKLPG